MKNVIALLVLLLLCFNGWGCAPASPPEHFSVDDGFSVEEADVIRDAVGAWCDVAGYCPTEALWAERGAIRLVPDLDDRGMAEGEGPIEVVARNTHDSILVAANRTYNSLQVLWVSVAHEIGHYCTDHLDSGLMGALQKTDSPMEIDAAAVNAFHAGCP